MISGQVIKSVGRKTERDRHTYIKSVGQKDRERQAYTAQMWQCAVCVNGGAACCPGRTCGGAAGGHIVGRVGGLFKGTHRGIVHR